MGNPHLALAFNAGSLQVQPSVVAERPRGEARVRMRLAGVCATDLEIARGYMGFSGVLGHEFVGEVLDATDSSWIGARVVGGINCGCGRCELCAADRSNHCPNRTVLGILGRDGVFQESFLLPEQNLVRVPERVSDEQAVFAEPLAAAFRITEQIDLLPWQRVAVIGDGRLGILITWVLAERVHSITLFGRHPGRVPMPAAVQERNLEGDVSRKFDVVVDATGSRDGLASALSIVRPEGTVVLKTTCAGSHELSLAPVVIDEITLVGSRCGPIGVAARSLAESSFPFHTLVDRRYPLHEGVAAMARAAEPGVLKVLIEGSSSP